MVEDNKGRPFRLALPRADYSDNSAERSLLMPVNAEISAYKPM